VEILLSFCAFHIGRDSTKSNSSRGFPSIDISIRWFKAVALILFLDLLLIRFFLLKLRSQSAVWIGKSKANSAKIIRFGMISFWFWYIVFQQWHFITRVILLKYKTLAMYLTCSSSVLSEPSCFIFSFSSCWCLPRSQATLTCWRVVSATGVTAAKWRSTFWKCSDGNYSH